MRVIDNNVWAIKFAWFYGKWFCFSCFVSIFIGILGDYIGMNLGKWIFDGACNKNVVPMKMFVLGIAVFAMILNLSQGIVSNYRIQFEKTDILIGMTKKLINSSFRIKQERMDNPEFYDIFMRAIGESNNRIPEVVSNFASILYGMASLVLVVYISISVNTLVTICILTYSILSTISTYIINNIEYTRYMDNAVNERRLSYIIRLIYQPEYSKSIRLEKPGLSTILNNKLIESSTELKKNIKKYYNKLYVISAVGEVLGIVLLKIVPWFVCIDMLYTGKMTYSEVTVVLSSVTILPNVYDTLFNGLISLKKNSMYINNYRKVIKYGEDDQKGHRIEEKEIINSSEIVNMSNVTFSYPGSSVESLHNIHLTINRGEYIAVVGESGAGKTTLIMNILNLYNVSHGDYLIFGYNQKIHDFYLNGVINYMGNYSQLYGISVAENILMRAVESRKDYEIVKDALEKVGLYDKVMNTMYQMDSIVYREFDEYGIDFSMGERQRLFIARMYVSDAPVLILDEPTSNLDYITENRIMNLLEELFTDRTVVVISHKLSLTMKADRILYMSDGTIKEQGTHEELLSRKAGYYHLFNAQIK